MQEELCETLTVGSCLDCLVLAHLYNALDLKEAAVKFVVTRSAEFVDQVNISLNYRSLCCVKLRCCVTYWSLKLWVSGVFTCKAFIADQQVHGIPRAASAAVQSTGHSPTAAKRRRL